MKDIYFIQTSSEDEDENVNLLGITPPLFDSKLDEEEKQQQRSSLAVKRIIKAQSY